MEKPINPSNELKSFASHRLVQQSIQNFYNLVESPVKDIEAFISEPNPSNSLGL